MSQDKVRYVVVGKDIYLDDLEDSGTLLFDPVTDEDEEYVFEEEYLVDTDEMIQAHLLCRYGCGHEASESFGVCDCEGCLEILITDYPEAMMGR